MTSGDVVFRPFDKSKLFHEIRFSSEAASPVSTSCRSGIGSDWARRLLFSYFDRRNPVCDRVSSKLFSRLARSNLVAHVVSKYEETGAGGCGVPPTPSPCVTRLEFHTGLKLIFFIFQTPHFLTMNASFMPFQPFLTWPCLFYKRLLLPN